MEKHLNFAIAAGALVVVLGRCTAIAAPLGQQAGTAAHTDQADAAQTTARVRGTIAQYDAARRRRRLAPPTGPAEFAVPRNAHVSRRGAPIDLRELERLT